MALTMRRPDGTVPRADLPMITLQLVRDEQARTVCRITQDADAPADRVADLRIVARVELRHPDGISEETLLHKQRLRLAPGSQDVPLPQQKASYDYHGEQIAVRLTLRLTDEKGKLLAEARLRDAETALLAPRPRLAQCPRELMSPKDEYSLLANLRALPASLGMSVAASGLALYVVAGLNFAVGIRDQFVAEPQLTEMQRFNLKLEGRTDELSRVRVAPILYSKGRRLVPILDSFKISLLIAALAWFILNKHLHRYGDFHLYQFLPPLRPGTRIAAQRLIRGRPHVDLFDATVRVVAGNVECWRRKPGGGEKVEKKIRTPARAVKLYEYNLPYVPAGSSISPFLKGDVDFTPMFRALYPALMVTSESGLDLVWQVQLLHPEFVDKALPGPTSNLRFADFLEGDTGS
jgi:hypothetical protein